MKKLSIFLISLMLLTFSNSASSGFFGDIFKELFGDSKNPADFLQNRDKVNNIICKVEYTQLDLTTGLEKTVEYNYRYNVNNIARKDDIMYLSAQDLTDEMNIWINESTNNIITNMTIINCKERREYSSKFFVWHREQRWSEYKGCPSEFNVELIDLLDRPKQRGYNVNIDRLTKDYEDGCKNYESMWK
jgi:hypothetical protein